MRDQPPPLTVPDPEEPDCVLPADPDPSPADPDPLCDPPPPEPGDGLDGTVGRDGGGLLGGGVGEAAGAVCTGAVCTGGADWWLAEPPEPVGGGVVATVRFGGGVLE
jgi:hypothetical protein